MMLCMRIHALLNKRAVLFGALLVCAALLGYAAGGAVPSKSDLAPAFDYDSMRDELVTRVNTDNPSVALRLLTQGMNDQDVSENCHALVHEIGHAAYVKYGSFEAAMHYQDDTCGAGYIHGVIELVFKGTSNLDEEMNTICADASSKSFRHKCYHGVGHGLMFYSENDVPFSISKCDEYRDNAVKIACSEGVFMENFGSSEEDNASQFLNPADFSYPCTEQSTFFKGGCYFYAPIYFLKMHENNYELAFAWCSTLDPAFRLRCVSGVASRVMKQYWNDPTVAMGHCARVGSYDEAACLDGLVSYYLVQTNSVEQTLRLCDDQRGSAAWACRESVEARRGEYTDATEG